MQIFSSFSPEIQIFLVVIIALIFGSFASLLSYRLAHKQPIVFTRSKCTSCGTALKILNLIPFFSWIFQGGKCSECKAKISIRYPLIELSFVIAFLTIFFTLGREMNVKMILHFLIATTLIVMCVIDLEEYFIPDSTQYFLAVLVTLLLINQGGSALVITNLKAAFLFAAFGVALWVFFYFAAHLEAIGIDDIKFFFITGLMLGTKDFLSFMLLSGVCGLLFGAIWQKLKKDETFPFAPAICFSFFICLLFDKKIDPVDLLGSALFFQGI